MSGDFGYKGPGEQWSDNTGNLPVGTVRCGPMGEEYVLCQFDDGDAVTVAAAGKPVGILGSAPGKVTSDFSASASHKFVGVSTCAMTDQYYGWFLRKGWVDSGKNMISGGITLVGDGGITADQGIFWSGDLVFDSASYSSGDIARDDIIGFAEADDSGNDLTSARLNAIVTPVPAYGARP